MATAPALPAWSDLILQQLAGDAVPEDARYAIVHIPAEGSPYIIDDGYAASEAGAIIIAEDYHSKAGAGEVRWVKLDELRHAAVEQLEHDTAAIAADPVGDQEAPATTTTGNPTTVEITHASVDVVALADGTTAGPDPDTGRIFEVPRVGVLLDETDPTVLKLAFSGGLELDRADPGAVKLYNDLKAGRDVELRVTAFVAGGKMRHRRDSDGDVDAVVQTKSLIVHSVTVDE